MPSPGDNIRQRQEEQDGDTLGGSPPRPNNNAAAPGTVHQVAGEQQRVIQREDGQHIVQNSPYGTKRISLGWGDLFKKPIPAFDFKNFPNVFIGTSSLNGVSGKKREMPELMKLYLKKFRCIEHCAPYHRMNDIEHWTKWKEMVPKDFVYTVKANNYLTHIKNLEVDADTTAHIKNFFDDRCTALGEKLGPVLIQLPPTFSNKPTHLARIAQVAALIPPHVKVAIEFRHPSWYTDEVYGVLRQCKWSLVATHNQDVGNSPIVDTGSGFLYCRLHGAVSQYVGDYGRERMAAWANIARRFLENNLATNPDAKVYIFLNNNESHISSLTSSIVDATALSEELFKGGPIVIPAVAAPAPAVQQQQQQQQGAGNNAEEPVVL